MSNNSGPPKVINVAVVGVSGSESIKGNEGVGKSLICNRFVRPAADDFFIEHCSVLSQTDFGGSPVINNEHWLYWGERLVTTDDQSNFVVRIVEQTEFIDDETYEPIAGSSKEDYSKRCCRVNLSSRDKLMYIQKEQLGLEADYAQQVLPDGKFNVDGFVLVCDVSRACHSHLHQLSNILSNLGKTKKPVVVAFSKCDTIDEEARKNILNLISKKDIKNVHLPPIETSSFHDVNVEELFQHVIMLCQRHHKNKRKTLPYYEAAHLIEQKNIGIRNAYSNLLSHVMPLQSWPTQRFAWNRLLADLDRHRDFTNFVRIYGSRAAFRMYEQYVCEAREHWMSTRLRALVPQLPRIFAILLEKSEVIDIEWAMAKQVIQSHALFDEFFQPIGSLGRQLDPLSPEGKSVLAGRNDDRIPAEILMLPDAKLAFENFKSEVHAARLKEKQEEEFEILLSETREVTPGKLLKDVSIFLQGATAYECLSPTQTTAIYERYQHGLIKRAEGDFVECLLEYVELLMNIIVHTHSTNINDAMSNDDLNVLKDYLEQDRRYRWMSKIFDLRDHLIYTMASFYRMPSTSKCPAASRCSDIVLPHTIDRFFHRRNDIAYTHLIDVVVRGETSLVAQFIAELSCFLRNEPFPCACGNAFIRCFGDEEGDQIGEIYTDVYVIDSQETIDKIRQNVTKTGSISPIFVVVCDPSNFDCIPILQQQGAHLAAEIGGSFFGVGGGANAFPNEDLASTTIPSDCSSLLGRDQLMSICDSVCSSQLTHRKRDLRIQVSSMCGDQFSIDSFIANIFGDFEQISHFRPIVHPNLIAGGVVPVDIQSPDEKRSKLRVELAFCSYHSWIAPSTSYKINSTHGHVFVYSTRRTASFAHARAAICRLLDRGSESISGKYILVIAVTDLHDNENSILLTEGQELSTSIGAGFIAIHSGVDHHLTQIFSDYFYSINDMYFAQSNEASVDLYGDDHGDGYASLVDHVRPTSLNLSSNNGPMTHTSFQNIMARQDVENKKKKPAPSRPSALKILRSEGRQSRTGPVHLQQYRMSQPDIQIAPLATPEMLEIAPEYSLVNDALTCDEHIYETLDFASRSKKDMASKKSREQLEVPSVSGPDTIIPESIARRVCRDAAARRARTACLSSSPDPSSRLHRTSNLLLDTNTSPSPPAQTDGLVRSIKANSNGRESRKSASTAPIGSTFRQSLSAESLVELMKDKKKRRDFSGNRFVRKVATSFRFRKDKIEEKRIEGRKSEEKTTSTKDGMDGFASHLKEKMASRSLPQSPHMERKGNKKAATMNTTEKVSHALSWLPSRSPKRSHKDKSSTVELSSSISSSTSTSSSTQGVILNDENLESLCTSSISGIPIYVEKCIEFIENNGGFDLEGLYRVPGNQAHLADVERKFLQTGELDVSTVDIPVHVVATALKNFFSCLPSPLIPQSFHTAILEVAQNTDKLRHAFSPISSDNKHVLLYLIRHLTRVSNSPKTAMDLRNLSKVWFPTLFRPNFDSYEALSTGTIAYQLAMETIFVNAEQILE